MRKLLFLLIGLFAFQVLSAQVKVRAALQPDNKTYVVYFRPDVSYNGPLGTTVSSQLSMRVPTGGFEVGNMMSFQGMWNKSVEVVGPEENSSFDYVSFSLVSTTGDIPYVAGEEVAIFSFENIGTCTGELEFISNTDDPFLPPNSQDVNVGNAIFVFGSGLGVNTYSGPYAEQGYTCMSNVGCGITFNGVELTSPTTCGTSDGVIEIFASTDLGLDLVYSIDDGDTWHSSPVFTGLTSGDYNIWVRDVASICLEEVGLINLPGPLGPIILDQQFTNPDCDMANGTITIDARTDSGDPVEFSIDLGATWQSSNVLDGLEEGTYYVQVRNAVNLCITQVGPFELEGCTGNPCIMYYEIEQFPGGRYQVSLLSDITWPSPTNITSNLQVTLKAPAGGLIISDLQSEVPDVSFSINGTYPSPTEAPNHDYFTISLATFPTSDINYIQGTKIPLFSFTNDGDCGGGGEVALIENNVDAFFPPNSQNANVGQQLFVFAYGADVPICLNANNSAPCVDDPPPPPTNLPTDSVYVTIPTDQTSTECLTAVLDLPNGLGTTSVCSNGTFVNVNPTNGSDCVELIPQSDFMQTDEVCVIHCDNVDATICDTTYIFICPQVQIQPVAAGCEGSSFQLETIGGAGTFTWSNGDLGTPITVTPSVSTTYTVTADNGLGCSTTDQVEVTILAPPSSDFSFAGICLGDATNFTPAQSGATSYAWEFGDTNSSTNVSPSHVYDMEGTYSVTLTVIDANGCTSMTTNNVTIGGAGAGSGTRTTVNACGGEEVTLSASTGTSYLWSPATGLSDPTVANPVANVSTSTTYTVTVGGTGGCGTVDTVHVEITPAPVIINVLSEDVTNCDVEDGSIKITATDGGNTLEYSIDCGLTWSSNSSFLDLPKGTYGIMVRSVETGCTTKWVDDVVFTGPMTPMITNVTTTAPTACGSSDATLTIETTDTNVEYSIDGGTTWTSDNEFTGLEGGTFVPEIRFQGESCSSPYSQGTVSIVDNAAPTVLNPIDKAYSCDGSSKVVTIEISENIASYNINSTGNFSNDNTNGGVLTFEATPTADSSDFEVIIEGASGCTVVETFKLFRSETPELSVIEKANTECNNATGSFALSINGGNAPYTYTFSDASGVIQQDIVLVSNATTFTDLAAGIYTITLADEGSCAADLNVEIEAMETNFGLTHNMFMPDCNSANGSIEIMNAPSNSSIEWLDENGEVVSTAISATDLSAGIYTVRVVDENTGCFQIEEITLESAGAPEVLLGQIIEPFCAGDASGVVSLQVNGTGEYQVTVPELNIVQVINGDQLSMISGFPAGDYQLVVENAAGCESMLSVTVLENALQLDLDQTQPSDCSLDDGQLCLELSNGEAPYIIQTSLGDRNNVGVSEQICYTDIAPGSYEITIFDARGCQTTETLTFAAANQPTVDNEDFVIDGFSCPGDVDNGMITSTLSSEFDVYDLDNNFVGTTPIIDLSEGTYVISVDKNGCAAQTTVDLTSTVNPWEVTPTITNETCVGDDGAIQLLVQGGNGNYAFLWAGSQSISNTANDLSAGNSYAVTIQDFRGCETIVDNLTVDSDCQNTDYPDSARLQTLVNVPLNNICMLNDFPIPSDATLMLCEAPENGTVELAAGTCFSYVPNQDFVGDDEFCIEICDASGDCHQITVLMSVDGRDLEIMTGMSPNGDFENDYLTIKNIESYPNNTVKVYNRWGNLVFKKEGYSNDFPWKGDFYGAMLPSGTYYIVIDLGDGEQMADYIQMQR